MGIGLFLYRKMATLLLFGSKWGEASNIVGAWGLMMMCSVIFYSFPAELYKSKGIPQMLFLSQCIFVIYDTNMRSNSKVWILDYGVFALWGYNNSDDHWDCLYEEIF